MHLSYRLFKILGLLASFAFTLSASAATKIVFLAGARSHGPGEHEYRAGCLLLAKALNEQSGLDVKATVIQGWPKDETVLDDAQAIVVYADGNSVVKNGWEKMDALAKTGVGLMFMHYAVEPASHEEADKYFRPWIGGAFEKAFSVNPHWVADLKILPNHPVSRGVGSLEAYDEFYYNIQFAADRSRVKDFLTATPDRERIKRYINVWNQYGVAGLGKPQTLLWGMERPDGGRGAGFTGGHYHRNWAIDGFRKVVLNAIVWVAKMEVPQDGVKSNPISEDELNANLDDKGPNPPRLTVPQPGEFKKIRTAEIQVEREKAFGKVEPAAEAKATPKPEKSAKPKKEKQNTGAGPKPVFQTERLTSTSAPRLVNIEAPLKGAKELYLVVSSEGPISCDWADWIEPKLVMADGSTKDLTKIAWKSATAGSGHAQIGKSNTGTPLMVNGETLANGVGTHARSVIYYQLPEGVEKFTAQGAIDDGGLVRNGKPSDAMIRFQVFTQKPPGAAAPEPVIVDDGKTMVPPQMFSVPEGLEVTVWATSPQLFNPTNIAFDGRGRLWVAEGVDYRSKAGRRPEGDRIVILEDTTGAGKADKSTVFVQESGLAAPLGIAVFDNKVVVSQPPDMLVYTDVNGDGKFDSAIDQKEALLTGFNGRQHDHSLHSVSAGPDGLWYWNQGNTGAQFTDKSGKTFHMGSPYVHANGKGVVDPSTIAGMKSDDGHVWIGGFAARMNPDGTNVTIIGHNFRNSYEQAVTSFGDVFQSDNDDPPACRVTPMMEGGNAGFASADGKRSWAADKRPGQDTPTAEWRQEDPGTMPAGDVYGGGSPTGVAFYENGAMGEKWKGLLLACEAGKNVVFGYFPKPDGGGWKLERFDFFTSNKEKKFAGSDFLGGKPTGELRTRFRPSDVAVGPDGAIYVADWFDARVGGHGTLDDRYTGTIYRIAPKGYKPHVPKLSLETTEGQIAALKSPAVNVRWSGFTRLKAQGEKAVPDVAVLLKDENPYIAARAAWLLAQMGEAGVAKVKPWLEGKDAVRRLVAYRALRRANVDVLGMAGKMVSDKSAAVRREVALTLRDVPAEQSVPLLVKLAKQFDGKDRAYLEAFGMGSEGKEPQVYEAVAKEMGGKPEAWSEAFAWITWRLHPAKAAEGIKARALSAKLNPDQRKLMVTALGFVKSREASEAMIALAKTKDFPLKDLATWWLFNRKGNDWKDYQVEDGMKAAGLYDPANVKLTAVEMPPAIKDAPPLPEVAEILKLPADPKRGAIAVTVCYTCHKIGKVGIEFGPELTAFGQQQPAEVIANAIANPSAEISHGFEGSEVKTKDGLTITGMVLSSGDPLIIKCMGGVVQTVPRDRIASVKKMDRSLMYDPPQLGLTGQAIADIVAYLKSGKIQ